jgi:hypothetical protein
VTNAEVRQSHYDHWHLREEIIKRVRANTPSRTRRKRV